MRRLTRLEIVPVRGVEEQLDAHLAELPVGLTVAVTSSPRFGLDRTLEYAEVLARAGTPVAPHLAAKHVRDPAHLADVVGRLRDAGIHDVFVVGGDGDDVAGEYKTGAELVDALAASDHGFDEIGVAAYPEGHPSIDDRSLLESLAHKQHVATYMVTQMCFDPPGIVDWIRRVRRWGIHLPVHVGVAGAVRRTKLLQMSVRLGVGQSMRYVSKQHRMLSRLVGPRSYDPLRFVANVEALIEDESALLRGYQLFTFNEVARTLRRLR